MEKRKDTLVIIPTYGNFVSDLKNAIDSIRTQVMDENIVIVDVYPNYNIQILKKHYKKLIYLSRESNSGPAGGRNKGLLQLKKYHRYVLFFDHDMIAEENMINSLIKRINMNDNIGITTPKIVYLQNKKIVWSAGTDINLMTGKVVFYGGKDDGQFNVAKEVSIAPATLLVKREVLEKLNGFNEKYITTYEDSEFCFRAKMFKWTTWYEPEAKAIHNLSLDTRSSYERLLSRSFYIARNRIWFMRNFGKPKNIFIIFLPIYFLYYLKIALSMGRLNAIVQYLKGSYYGFSTYW